MRRSRWAYGSLAAVGATVAVGSFACGEAFTATRDGGSDARGVTDGASSDVPSEDDGGSPESGGPPDASHEAGPCPGAHDGFMSDGKNCGGCGHVCQTGVCSGGLCELDSPATALTNPDGLAVDDNDDIVYSERGKCTAAPCTLGSVSVRTEFASGFTIFDSALGSDGTGIPVANDGTNAYWATSMSPGAVDYRSLMGTSPTQPITPPITASWVAMAVDDKYLYLAEAGGTVYHSETSSLGSGGWAALPGNSSQMVAGIAALDDVLAHYVFWSQSSSGGTMSFSVTGDTLGTSVAQLWTANPTAAPTGVALSPYGVYWVDGALVQTEALSGKGGSTTLVALTGLVASRVVSDGKGNVYWTAHDTSGTAGKVMGLYRGAATPIIFADGQANPTAISLSKTKVYWINSGTYNDPDGTVTCTWR
jgi:hypothetical protein